MELTLALAITIISCIISVSTFVLNRKDKSVKDSKEEQKQFDSHSLLEYRLTKIEQNIEKILNKLDTYDTVIDEKIEKAIKQHIAVYHNK